MAKTICIFAAHFYPHLGGIERYTHQLSINLIKKGYDVIIVTSNTEKCASEEEFQGIKIFRIPVINFIQGRLPIPLINHKFFKIFKKINGLKIDYYIINARFYIHSILGALIAKSKKKPALLIEHGTGHFTLNNKFLDFIGRIYEHSLTFILKFFVKDYFGVSEACNRWLKHFGISAKGVFYNGIDTKYRIKDEYNIKEKYFLPENSLILTFIGRLIPEKGILLLNNAFKAVSNQYDNLYLFIAGNGPLYEELLNKNNMEEKIFLLGQIDYDEVMNLLSQTDIFISPSYFPEGLPTSILEAGINRCCVIATPKGGTAEVINNEKLGVIIRPNSEQDIIDSITKLLNNKTLINIMQNNLYHKIKEEFDWHVIATNVSDYLKSLDGRSESFASGKSLET